MGCHQNGGRAPFPLTTYEEARPWAVAIREETTRRTMPPWNAVRGFGEFQDDPSLTQEEIQLIAEWVNGGAPPGDAKYLSGRLPNAWRDPNAEGLTAKQGRWLKGLRLSGLKEGNELRVVLRRPDGSRVPLLWVRRFDPRAGSVFVFRTAEAMPPGSRLEVQPSSLESRVEGLWRER